MMNKKMVCLLLITAALSVTVKAQSPDLSWASRTGAKLYPVSKKIYSVNDYGAVSDTITVNTKAIQKAIDECAAKGGKEMKAAK